MEKNLIVAQSGGPTSVINSSLAGIIKMAKSKKEITNIYGSLNGIKGIINENIIDLNLETEEDIDNLKHTPSAALGSVRFCLPNDLNDLIYQKILEVLKKHHIHYFFYIGGNDSMDTVDKLYRFFKKINYDCTVLGVPKTIDNDLVITDHTPGYGSAIKYIATTINEIYYDTQCYEKGRVTIVEIMGRDAGWLTAGSKLATLNNAGPDLIYLPEIPFDQNSFLKDVEEIYNRKQKVLICVSEGIKNNKGIYIVNEFSYIDNNDVFGHLQLGGVSTILASIVKKKLNLPVRAIELNLMQRCSSHCASLTDINEAYLAGCKAVEFALNNESGKMITFKRISNSPYQIDYVLTPISDIANKISYVPLDWIINGNDLSERFIEYASPLILNESKLAFKDGLPSFTTLKKHKIR